MHNHAFGLSLQVEGNEQDYDTHRICFAEYMIYSDMWELKRLPYNGYIITNTADTEITLTNSLSAFLERFLQGNVFDPGGLYDWHDEVKRG